MEGKPYPEAKRRILIELSTADFIQFLKEVTDQEGKLFIRNQLLQRRVPGFRDGRAPFTRTVSQLITKLKSEQELTNLDSAIWNSLANVWMYWVKSHQELDNTLIAFDNGADFDENHKCIAPPNSELDIECFKFLLKTSYNAAIHQEMIKRFYEYGYFNEDERIQNLINQIPLSEEIERREQLVGLPDKVDELSEAIDRLSENIEALNSRISAIESVNELEQRLTERTTEEHQYFDTKLEKLEQKVAEKYQLLNARFSNAELGSNRLANLVKRINSLESRLSKLNKSVKAFETKLPETEPLNKQEISQLVNRQMQSEIKQLKSRMLKKIKPFEERLNATEVAIPEIKLRITDEPRISTEALKIGEGYNTELQKKTERYENENDYLDDFQHCLRRFGMITSEDKETAAAIHIALKAFPAVEIADARIIRVWRLMCDNHFYDTTISVEMGWLGLQDWFPDLFARQCFGERLEPVDLEASIRKMLELGDMPWVIYFRHCDRSFPEAYLPRFLDWISASCHSSIRTLLIRYSGTNRCETNEDFYERVARLPKPKNREPIEVRNLKPSGVPLTLSEWASWCQPKPDTNSQYEEYLDFLEKLRSTVENRGLQVPIELLREIQHYLRLSHNIMAKTRALDWALTLRLLPWIGNRGRLIDVVENIVNENYPELPHFQEGLQTAREADA